MTQAISTSFFPPGAEKLTEATSIALANQIQTVAIDTPLSSEPIQTTYVTQGQGETPILLFHGFDSSIFEFRRLLPFLAEQANSWAVDLLGFGFTDRPAQVPFSPMAIKTHLHSFWRTMIGQPIVLVGASMGGAAAIDFALTYPEIVKKLVLIDSAGFTVPPAMGKFLISPLGYLATAFLKNPNVRQRISRDAYHNPSFASSDAQICAALHLDRPNWQQALIAFTRSGGYRSFRDQLAHLQPETLILWGESDRILGIKDAEQFHQAIAHSKLIWIAESGHVPHLEKPQITAEHILNWAKN